MKTLYESEFNELVKNISSKENSNQCEHDIVRIRSDFDGSHIEYGCIKCGDRHTDANSLKLHKI